MKLNFITTRVEPNSINNNQVNFTGKKSAQNNNRNMSSTSKMNLREIPLSVLLALSPLTVTNAQTPSDSAQHVRVEQNIVQTDPIRRSKTFISDKDKSYQFIKVDNDNDTTNYEGLFFEYKENYNTKLLRGRMLCIVDEPDSIGEYLGVYQKVNRADNNLQEMEVCKISGKIADYLLNFANSKTNNDAIIKTDIEEFRETFTEEEIANAKSFSEILRKEEY